MQIDVFSKSDRRDNRMGELSLEGKHKVVCSKEATNIDYSRHQVHFGIVYDGLRHLQLEHAASLALN